MRRPASGNQVGAYLCVFAEAGSEQHTVRLSRDNENTINTHIHNGLLIIGRGHILLTILIGTSRHDFFFKTTWIFQNDTCLEQRCAANWRTLIITFWWSFKNSVSRCWKYANLVGSHNKNWDLNGLFLNCTLTSVDNISIYSGVNLAKVKNKRLRVRELFSMLAALQHF